MASGGRKDKKEEESGSGWLTGLAVLGGAAALGYGAYKLITSLTEETPKKLPDSDEEEDHTIRHQMPVRALPLPGNRQDHDSLGAYNNQCGSNDPSSLSSRSLHERLQEYYKSHVEIPAWEMRAAEDVVDKVVGHFRDFIKDHDKAVEFWKTGSTTEGLKVISPDEFDIMVVVDATQNFMTNNFEYDIKQPVDLPNTAGFYTVSPVNAFVGESGGRAKRWVDPALECVENGYLSPEKARRSFKGMMDKAFHKKHYSGYEVRRKEQGPSVMLEVTYTSGGQRKNLSIDFVPAYKFGNKVLVAKPHPKVFSDEPDSKKYANLWRVSFSREEREQVRKHSQQEGCKLKCLKILKAVRLYHHSELGTLSSYILKTTWLHMAEDDEEMWEEEALSEYFIDLLKRLEECLKSGHLDHFFCPSINVLCHLSQNERMHAVNFLSKEIGKGTYAKLLKVQSKDARY